MKSSVGEAIKLSVFGESHGAAIGAVLEGLPAGHKIDFDFMLSQMARRAPGRDNTTTSRKEEDLPEILSGALDGVTTGAPLTLIIRNKDTISKNYDNLKVNPRPSHSDYAAYVRYNGFNDVRGGGHFSGRLTAPIVAAGAICRGILKEYGIAIGGHIFNIGEVTDNQLDPVNVTAKELDELSMRYFSLVNKTQEDKMRQEIEKARTDLDSVGGSVELAAVGLPVGLGNPMFRGVENVLSNILYGVPAVKGVSFGAGFGYSVLKGSNANDNMYYDNGKVVCKTNNCGGITGGITNGMPLTVMVALKPTPSISVPQQTVNLNTKENEELVIEGRHDPCIVPRALPALEAALSIGLLDLMAEGGKL
ncbi:MAG: chorismate synthase [Clostridia bacterium]|nr:chorismate synthase [Clostridia bacterium]